MEKLEESIIQYNKNSDNDDLPTIVIMLAESDWKICKKMNKNSPYETTTAVVKSTRHPIVSFL